MWNSTASMNISVPGDGSRDEGSPAVSISRAARPASLLWSLFSSNRPKLLATYLLFNLENLIRLAQPFVIGLAINDLLQSSYLGLWIFVAQHIAHLVVSSFRQMYDTRTFSDIYSELVTNLVVEQRERDVKVSRVAARSMMSRQFVDFLERSIPMIIRVAYSIVGALVMLAFYDWMLMPFSLALVLPALLINRVYARSTLSLSQRLHDQLEREVDIIEPGYRDEVRDHFDQLAGWRIKLSDREAWNFGIMEFFVLIVLVISLLRTTSIVDLAAGDIFAVFRYLMLLFVGLDSVPKLVQQVSQLRDIDRRVVQS